MPKHRTSPPAGGQSLLGRARDFVRRGWSVVPIPKRSKGPRLLGWQNLRLGADDLPHHFSKEGNIGVLLGEASGGLVDVDLDCPEAVALADTFLPDTQAVFGRKSKPRSHRLYYATPVPPARRFAEPKDSAGSKGGGKPGAVLVELRSSPGVTVFPGSVHPGGEAVEWDVDGEPASVAADDLVNAVQLLAAAALLARHWPAEGSRHHAALALAGGLLRAGWREEHCRVFIQAVAQAAGDKEAAKRADQVGPTAERLEVGGEATGWPKLAELLGDAVARRAAEWLGARADAGTPEEDTRAARTSAAARLIELASQADLFHASPSEAYATVPLGTRSETYPVEGGGGFALWLRRRYYEAGGGSPGDSAMEEAIACLKARALFDGPIRPVHVRVGGDAGAVYVDLADESGGVVEITGSGWRVVDGGTLPVRFVRPEGMLPLPAPQRGGALGELGEYLRLDEDDAILLIAWLVGALRPRGPYPILVLNGEQGAGKSTATRLCKALIDPNKAPVRSEPQGERDLFIAARNNWCLAFDNLSRISRPRSDALCQLSTGGGLSVRRLFTNSHEVIFNVQRPLILNGIEDVVNRPDLADRCIPLLLRGFGEGERVPEGEFWKRFEAARPRILGALFDTVSAALRREPGLPAFDYPRMADFARWVVAAEPSLPWEPGRFLEAYLARAGRTAADLLEGSPVCAALVALAQFEGDVTLTCKELLRNLEASLPSDRYGNPLRPSAWPESPKGLANTLRRYAPGLRKAGVDVQDQGRAAKNGARLFRITFRAPELPDPSEPVPDRPCLASGTEDTERTEDEEASPLGEASVGGVKTPRKGRPISAAQKFTILRRLADLKGGIH